MSSHPFTPNPASNPSYEPLPLTTDDHMGHALYNAPHPDAGPPSPGMHTPMMGGNDLPDDDLPMGAARPRFLGHAAYQDGGGGVPMRGSYAESHTSLPSMDRHSEQGSVYGLTDAPPLSQGFYGGYRDDPNSSSAYLGQHGMQMGAMGTSRNLDEKRAKYAAPRSKRKVMIWAILISAILLIAAVLIPLYFAVIRPRLNNSDNSSPGKPKESSKSDGKPVKNAIVTGGDGSTVTMENGETFTYKNSFGGYWYYDQNDPFNNGARAQSWSPALNETFKYGTDKIRGVNLGGWLTIEPFIAPALFEQYLDKTPPAVDEWTLHTYMAADTANGGISQIENHYKTFITEKDFADIAAAGLNYVRIPLPYWAIEVRANEPFLPKTAWTYFLKAIQWARKYGIRINLDFHAVPGSQNGWNHSGRLGIINMLKGPMGVANAQRTLDYIRIITEFISQPQYKDVVTMFGILNEPQGAQEVGDGPTFSFYLQAYLTVRNVTGNGEGKGPWISYHDAFFSRDKFANFIPNGDRLILDSHPYLCFGGQSDAAMDTYINTPCNNWGGAVNKSMSDFGMTSAGEFSNAVTDCGLWVTGVNQGTRYEGTYILEKHEKVGDCTPWTDYKNWTPQFKAAVKAFALSSMDALQDYFFWTWKIGESRVTKKVESPQWSYKLGLDNGWMPLDPREAQGKCGGKSPWQPPLQPWQTGGAGAGDIPATLTVQYPWPPATITGGGAGADLPQYTPTGVVPTLPGPSFSFASATATPSVGNGWANPADTAGLMVEKQGCTYLDPWIQTAAAAPPVCTA